MRDAATNIQQGEFEDHPLPAPPRNLEPIFSGEDLAADDDPYLPLVTPTDVEEISRGTKRQQPDSSPQPEPSLPPPHITQQQQQVQRNINIEVQSPTHKTINIQLRNFGIPDALQPVRTPLRRARSRTPSRASTSRPLRAVPESQEAQPDGLPDLELQDGSARPIEETASQSNASLPQPHNLKTVGPSHKTELYSPLENEVGHSRNFELYTLQRNRIHSLTVSILLNLQDQPYQLLT